MTTHTSHQMTLTSLMVRFPRCEYSEKQFNGKFRQEIERKIIAFHNIYPQGITDHELLVLFGNPDTNLVRPRRADLTKDKTNKKGIMTRPSFLMDSGEKRVNRFGRLCIVWKLNSSNLISYMDYKECLDCSSKLFNGECPVCRKKPETPTP